MAKPAKVKKDQAATPAKQGGKKAARGKSKEVAAKAKSNGKGKKEEARGFRARVAKAQSVKQGKPARGAAGEKRSAGKFLREVRVEMSKVTWPSREELIQSTLVVLLAVAIAGTFIAILDVIFSRLITIIS